MAQVRKAADRSAQPTAMERTVIAQQAVGASKRATARAAGITPRRVDTLLRSRAVQEGLRHCFVAAGITEEYVAGRLREMFEADKQVLRPDGNGGWYADREPDWKAFAEAMRLYLAVHERLMRAEADEEADPDREMTDVTTQAEKDTLSRADLFRLYQQRLTRRNA